MQKLKIKKGDLVKVIAGENKNSTGKVLSVDKQKNRAVVEGVNIVKKATRPNAKSPQGGIVEKEASIHVSNLMLMDGNTPTRVGRRRDESGKIVRYSKKSGEVIK